MKEAGRSEHSETVVKKKSSSGCLIIKKKVKDTVGGVSDSTSRNLFKSPKKKKRRRVARSDSESSDNSSETKVDKFHNAYQASYLENREFETEKRVGNGLDVFEFDEYDGFDDRRIRKETDDGRYRWKLYRQSGDQLEHGNGGSRMSVDNNSTTPAYGTTSRLEMEDDESDLPLSVLSKKYRLSSNKPIRLQGKNGVLKVMVNKNKQMGVSRTTYDHVEAEDWKELKPTVTQKKLNASFRSSNHRNAGDGQSSRSDDTNKNKAVVNSSFYLDSKCPGKPAISNSEEKSGLKSSKSMVAENSKEVNESDTPKQLKLYSRRAVVKKEGTSSPVSEKVTGVKGKERKVKRGSGTEKQLLREKIKNMLLAAGWTIDYRPRRNRDYLDAVYISHAGTAYWSIIKAYDAFQKEEVDNSKAGGNFTPLPDEVLGKLTRQTRKKMEREMKKKRKNEGSSRNAKRPRVNEDVEGSDSDQKEEKLNSYVKHSHKSKKTRLEEASQDSGDDSSENSYNERTTNDRAAKTTVGTDSHTVHGRKSWETSRCTLLVRSSNKGSYSENDGCIPYSGKQTLLSWLIDSGVVHMSEHVQYMNRRKTRILQKGWITKDGIHCGCCSKILTVSKFELHAGSKLRQPFPNIFLQSGKSLMQCQIDAWNKQGELEREGFYTVDVDGDDPNDDTCGLCGDGGDLICCDGCPSTFHLSCLDMQTLPQGDWHCPNCSCKYCGRYGGDCTEVSNNTEASLSVCCLCQKKYHESCRPEIDLKSIESNYPNLCFCEQKCQELYSHLQKLLGVKHGLGSGFSWSLIHRSDLLADTSSVELSHRVECNSMLAVAMSVMDECFLPFTDRRSGTNLIRNVVFNCGSNLSRLNYSGFFTAILERGEEVICAASIRIHGTQLAEMPFIGTRHVYRRQGMCRRLLSAIESALSSLEVEKLIIPAIAEHMHTWTDVFGFHPLEESHKQELKSMNMLVFPGTDMLQKPLMNQGTPNAISEGNNAVEVDGCKALSEKSELLSSDVELSQKNSASDSGSQESTLLLEGGCSIDATKETLPTSSPVKEEMPVNKSELVSHPSGGLDGIDTNMQHGNDITLQISDADPQPAQVRDVASHDTVSSDIPVEESTVQVGDEIMANVTQVSSDLVSSAPCEAKLQLAGKESNSSDPNVEVVVQNGNETNLPPTHQIDDASHDSIPSDIPCEVQQSLSFSNPNVEEVAVQNGNGTNLPPTHQVDDPSHDNILSDIPCEERESFPSSNAEVAVQNGKGPPTHQVDPSHDNIPWDIPCQVQLLEKETSSSVDVHRDSEIDVQNGCETTDVISLEADAPNAISSETPCEVEVESSGVEPLSLNDVIVRVETLSGDDAGKEDKMELCGGGSDGMET